MNITSQFQVDILKKRLSFAVLNAEKGHFLAVYQDLGICIFSNVVRFGLFKKCSRVICCVLDENLA